MKADFHLGMGKSERLVENGMVGLLLDCVLVLLAAAAFTRHITFMNDIHLMARIGIGKLVNERTAELAELNRPRSGKGVRKTKKQKRINNW